MNIDELKQQIQSAFAAVEYPGDWCLRDSNEGDEPFYVEAAFKGKTDWRAVEAKFLDRMDSALSFLSIEAFRFYIPAYMIADLDGKLEYVEPYFYLCHGLDDESKHEQVNLRRYGERTWWDDAVHKFSVFNAQQAAVIIEYLQAVRKRCDGEQMIDSAIRNYWARRAAGRTAPGHWDA